MRRAVVWSTPARRDLAEIISFIAADRRDAAVRVRKAIDHAALNLGQRPTGRAGRAAGIYEKSVTGLPYILAYSIAGDDAGEIIHILRVIHTARDWPTGGWPRE